MKLQFKDLNGNITEIEVADPVLPANENIDPLKTNMCTVIMQYFATGEGTTYAVMYTRGYGPHADRKKNALDNFVLQFGEHYAFGAEVYDGMVFDFPGNMLLVSESLKRSLINSVRDAGGLEYHASYHVNYS
jgi:hypothetical protein